MRAFFIKGKSLCAHIFSLLRYYSNSNFDITITLEMTFDNFISVFSSGINACFLLLSVVYY